MDGGKIKKQQAGKAAKSIWEQIKAEEKDWFFQFMEKKVRNLNKKLKDIEKLEEDLKEKKELKPE